MKSIKAKLLKQLSDKETDTFFDCTGISCSDCPFIGKLKDNDRASELDCSITVKSEFNKQKAFDILKDLDDDTDCTPGTFKDAYLKEFIFNN